ncbi:hypothetical protein [Chamaesiphon minutus]|uniref:Uncharacterized protein n=1 Tax=Chamaesiphon minutus (strain ATCC 27169 / PCC 6605) TaxID=1173020 RepID=K9UBR3_CHAP6|nr:hypothetical protein [Chamaesiphon minutus]AFY92255.1 hypothetical protein Cha6605_1017 [Chamaesiphon minutus PCC 6605]
MVQFTQLNLLPPSFTAGLESKIGSKYALKRQNPLFPPRIKKPKLELRYLAFDDDYFWELIKKDYASAWRYFDRMSRIL